MSTQEICNNQGLPLVRPRVTAALDPAFRPAALANRFYRKAASQSEKTEKVQLALERPDGAVSRFQTPVLHADHPQANGNFIYVERLLKFLLWARGASRVHVNGSSDLVKKLQKHFRSNATGKFTAKTMGERIFSAPFEVVEASEESMPEEKDQSTPLGRHWKGCRLGFDLGASDRKVAAVQDGKTVYSDEFPWDPRNQKDPQWHFDQIMEMLKKAAEHLPRVDAIGGSAAGVYVHNEVRLASLFRGVSDEDFSARIKSIFLDLKKAWNGIPFEVVNDGDVTALAGSMALESNNVLGIALGSSQAAGFINGAGNITGWLNELAFSPVDYNPEAPLDEWSGDYGCGVQYFSQQAVQRLLPASGLEVAETLPVPEKLVAVQEFMKKGDERAARIYETIGTYLGYSLPHYLEFYDFHHLLILGRVTSGPGGSIIVEQAQRVLTEEFPEFPLEFHIPDETQKRHGQAMAAASLPVLPAP